MHNLEIEIIGPSADWEGWIDRLFEPFRNGEGQGLLPLHFLRATYPQIGGRIVHACSEGVQYWGLLFPRLDQGASAWTLRSYWTSPAADQQVSHRAQILRLLDGAGIRDIHWYEYAEKSAEHFQGRVLRSTLDGLVLAEPNHIQARDARDLQSAVWHISDPAFLYPADLYHPESGLASRLVALDNGRVVGFLLGFYAAGMQWYGTSTTWQVGSWQESQVMGIQADYRGKGIARNLKLVQRARGLKRGLELIHWTVDPLQANNARLNFNSLGAVAIQHYKDHYPFRNGLNRVRSSRVGISWLIGSPRADEHARGEGKRLDFHTLATDSGTEIIRPVTIHSNRLRRFKAQGWTPASRTMLLEIPANWNAVQAESVAVAQAWREVSDEIFAKLLDRGPVPDYAVTGIVNPPGEDTPYLVIQKLAAELGI